MRKGPGSVYDRWNMSVVICDSFICMFSRSLFVFLYFFFGNCVVCSSMYGFWLLPLASSNSSYIGWFDLNCGVLTFQQYFRYIMATSFSGGGSRREPSTMGKQLLNSITCGCHDNLVTNRWYHEWGKDREVFMTGGTCPLSFVTQIFYNVQPSLGGEHKSFNITKRNLWFCSFLVSSNPLSRKSW
jgi:hypothetical protein